MTSSTDAVTSSVDVMTSSPAAVTSSVVAAAAAAGRDTLAALAADLMEVHQAAAYCMTKASLAGQAYALNPHTIDNTLTYITSQATTVLSISSHTTLSQKIPDPCDMFK